MHSVSLHTFMNVRKVFLSLFNTFFWISFSFFTAACYTSLQLVRSHMQFISIYIR